MKLGNKITEPCMSTKEVADRFNVDVPLVRLWCQNELVQADKVKGAVGRSTQLR